MNSSDKLYKPYIGARPFESTNIDIKRFAGRNAEIQNIVSLLYGHPIILIYGASGSGKTSIINAGIRHDLKERGFQVWPSARVKLPSIETYGPAGIRNPYVFHALQSLNKRAEATSLGDKSISEFISEHRETIGEPGPHTMHVLVFDQLEEIFTSPTKNWIENQTNFFKQLSDAVRVPVSSTDEAGSPHSEQRGSASAVGDPLLRIVLVIREEYLGQLEPFAHLLPEGLHVRYRLEPLTYAGAIEALVQPLAEPYSYAEGVPQKIVNDLSQIRWGSSSASSHKTSGRYVEPVQLQLVGQFLWEHLPADQTTITGALYRVHGNVDDILRRYYEQGIKAITSQTRVNENRLRQWFDTTLITPAATRGIVFRGTTESDGIPNDAVDILVDEHIIRGEERAGGCWYELSHDRWIAPIKSSNNTWSQRRSRHRQALALSGFFVGLIMVGSIIAGLKFEALNLNASIVPRPEDLLVDSVRWLPKPDYGKFHIVRDLRVIDLRSRRKLRFWQSKLGGKHSPVTWLRYTLARKKYEFTTELRFFFATTGFGVYPRCLTHSYHLEKSVDNDKLFPDKNLTEVWHVVADVSTAKKDEEFLVSTEATFWNAFQGEKEWASIDAVDESTASIGVSMIFPESNLYQTLSFVKYNVKTGEKMVLRQNTPRQRQLKATDGWKGEHGETYEVFLDQKNRTVFWLIHQPQPSTHYRYNISWTWDYHPSDTKGSS